VSAVEYHRRPNQRVYYNVNKLFGSDTSPISAFVVEVYEFPLQIAVSSLSAQPVPHLHRQASIRPMVRAYGNDIPVERESKDSVDRQFSSAQFHPTIVLRGVHSQA
jgi:hypothetical protein